MSADPRTLVDWVRNEENWKYPTKPIKVKTLPEAQKIADALSANMGGSEITDAGNGYVVSSRGYYWYVGE